MNVPLAEKETDDIGFLECLHKTRDHVFSRIFVLNCIFQHIASLLQRGLADHVNGNCTINALSHEGLPEEEKA